MFFLIIIIFNAWPLLWFIIYFLQLELYCDFNFVLSFTKLKKTKNESFVLSDFSFSTFFISSF